MPAAATRRAMGTRCAPLVTRGLAASSAATTGLCAASCAGGVRWKYTSTKAQVLGRAARPPRPSWPCAVRKGSSGLLHAWGLQYKGGARGCTRCAQGRVPAADAARMIDTCWHTYRWHMPRRHVFKAEKDAYTHAYSFAPSCTPQALRGGHKLARLSAWRPAARSLETGVIIHTHAAVKHAQRGACTCKCMRKRCASFEGQHTFVHLNLSRVTCKFRGRACP